MKNLGYYANTQFIRRFRSTRSCECISREKGGHSGTMHLEGRQIFTCLVYVKIMFI